MQSESGRDHSSDIYPRPDPTRLTTEQLVRELAGLKELLGSQIASLQLQIDRLVVEDMRNGTEIVEHVDRLRELHEVRFAAIEQQFSERDVRDTQVRESLRVAVDAALAAAKEAVNEQKAVVNGQLQRLQELHDEKFASVAQQFLERDTRGERESRDNKVAVDAAFAAQKEAAAKQDEANQKAIDKSEKATGETLDKQEALFRSTTDGLAAQLVDLKERMTRIEGQGIGQRVSNQDHQQSNSWTLALLLGALALGGFVMNIIDHIR